MQRRKWTLFAVAVVALLFAAILVTALLYPRVRRVTLVNESLVFQQPLFIPALLEARIINGEKVFDLRAQKGRTQLVPHKEAETAGFNSTYLGPTIRVHKCDRVRINVVNELGEPTTVHWHGMRLPAAMDGGPHQVISAGPSPLAK